MFREDFPKITQHKANTQTKLRTYLLCAIRKVLAKKGQKKKKEEDEGFICSQLFMMSRVHYSRAFAEYIQN